ncbi:lysostaphin resistance A-like protein [Clostridium septicum]|uniref:CPBP family intramembrane glutamic endopeptidase n=1 Tax=Clostridium septicum TaxID=1504 RepID=UPI003C12B6C0
MIYSCILGPIFEEVVYRGGLQTLLAPYGKKRAILISALIFGFMHHDLYQAIAAAALGIVLPMEEIDMVSYLPLSFTFATTLLSP